jgi:hypothetical protein
MWKSLLTVTLSLGLSGGAPAKPPELTIKDLAGKTHTPWADQKTKAVVLVFISTDCPIANFYQPSVRRLAEKYSGKGVAFYQIHPDPEVAPDDAKQHVRDFEITAPVAIDHGQRLTKQLQAKTTPEVFVLTPDGKTAYRGRIDDTYTTFGKRRPAPTKHDLKEALDAVLAGKKVAVPVTDSVGCRIFVE